MNSSVNDPHRAAQWYAANFGWRVFPVHSVDDRGRCTCGAHACSSPGKHPRTASGCLDATLDPDVIAGWWSRWPDAGVAIATGRGLVIVDVDPAAGGDDGLVDLRRALGELPNTAECLTGGGGRHLYLAVPEGVTVRNSASVLRSGVDVRGEGGYVLAPPSRHVSGRSYAWEASSDPDEVDLEPLPDAWLRAMTAPGSTSGTTTRARTRTPDEPIPAGQRNDTLTRVGGSLRAAGVGFDAILAALLAENASRCSPPLTTEEVERIAQSVHHYAPTHRAPGAALPITRELADEVTRDRAYCAILAALSLAPEHHEVLTRWGFTVEDIAAGGYRSLPVERRAELARVVVDAVGEELARRVPGIVQRAEHGRAWWSLAGSPGMVVPVRDPAGRVVALRVGVEDLQRGRTLGSAHRGGPAGVDAAHVPERARVLLDAGAARAVVVVGALRAELATARLHVPCVGADHLNAWRDALDALGRWAPQHVALVFDSTGAAPEAVERERCAATEAVKARGGTPERVQNFKGHKGFDHYLAALGRASVKGAA